MLLDALLPLIADLASDLPPDLRYRRLLDAVHRLLPCDAVALLRLDEAGSLAPVAIRGLSADTLGRRFRVGDHPRLRAILEAPGALLFPPDCDLPDPYDGLVDLDNGASHGPVGEVHDCMGCALRIGPRPWGMLTLDALDSGRFSSSDLSLLEAFAALAAATVAATARIDALASSVALERNRAEAYRLASEAGPRRLIGHSPAFEGLMREIDLVAASDLTVLVTGETGSGKELVARSLHARSTRRTRPLVVVNCAALPEGLVESELFGHVRGAFSGATGDRPGKFQTADGGTLFLDEVGELPLAVQAKLLRVLQDGQLQRVGSDREHRADVRLIAATNRDLADEVRAGRFRADLYHRLCTFPIRVPPLRERGPDILLLAGDFIEENRRRTGLRGLLLSPRAQAALLRHGWPGNVRELEYLIARATLKARGRQPAAARARLVTIEVEDLDTDTGTETAGTETGGLECADADAGTGSRLRAATGPDAAAGIAAAADSADVTGAADAAGGADAAGAADETGTPDLRAAVDAFKRHRIEEALARHRGNIAASARALGLDRANLVRLAKRLGVPITSPAAGKRLSARRSAPPAGDPGNAPDIADRPR